MYRELEYQLGGSQQILDDIKNFIMEHKIIILVLVLLLFVMFELNKNAVEGFKPMEFINKYVKTNYNANICDEQTKSTCSGTPGCEWVEGAWPMKGYCAKVEDGGEEQ